MSKKNQKSPQSAKAPQKAQSAPKPKTPNSMKAGKMEFKDFLNIHAYLWPAVTHSPGSVAHIQLMRVWNSFAILFPEKCADIIGWPMEKLSNGRERVGTMALFENDIDLSQILNDIRKKDASLDPAIKTAAEIVGEAVAEAQIPPVESAPVTN